MIGALVVSCAAFSVALTSSSSAGVVGLLMTYAIRATQSLSFAVRSSTALENMFISPDRVFEYIAIEPEQIDCSSRVNSDDIDSGDIELNNRSSANTSANTSANGNDGIKHSNHSIKSSTPDDSSTAKKDVKTDNSEAGTSLSNNNV